MKKSIFASLAATATLGLVVGCQPVDEVDDTDVERFRSALPTTDRLTAPTAEATTASSNVVGDPALYPSAARPIAVGVNGSVASMILILEFVTSLPPTIYNSETNEYVWGPYPNDDGVGYIAAYIRDTGGSGDFRYEYAFLRGISNDLATLSPVIYGGATPDANNEDRGVGVTLWDFEADRAFSETHDPSFDPNAGNRGRFAALYGAGEADDGTGNEAAFVVAVLRDFVSEDDPGEAASDLDYFYGRYQSPQNVIDFLDFEAAMDVDDPADGTLENVGVRLAFLDEGTGRAEADATGGSMTPAQRADVTECWDTAIDQTFVSLEIIDGGDVVASQTEGTLANCGLFEASLDDLGIPSLQDVDPALMAALDEVATNGIPAE